MRRFPRLLAGTLAVLAFACGGQDEEQLEGDSAASVAPAADRQLLEEIQRTTFRYFWESAHPASGMARERSTSGDTVTTGGTGFGLQAIVVGVERGWISRADAYARSLQIARFLEKADRFDGAWSHWVNGKTAKTIPFGAKDDGGDLVETALPLEGLLTSRAYFTLPEEAELRTLVDSLYRDVDFTAYIHDNALAWHKSPRDPWQMGVEIRGWNEGLIAYVLALGSPTHPIPTEIYTRGFTGLFGFKNSWFYGGYQLPLGPAWGGPLFLAHYSFLGMDPRKMADQHAGYWNQVSMHTRINRAWCVHNAQKDNGYSADLWGLTASDNPGGYFAHSPTDDFGTIAPTAALSSIAYTPYESLRVARKLRSMPRAWGPLGFVDALHPKLGWFDTQTIAIDQGPIILMIENYRTGLLWQLGMSAPEVKAGLAKANIAEPDHATGFYLATKDADDDRLHLVRHPDRGRYEIDLAFQEAGNYQLLLDDRPVWTMGHAKGTERVPFDASVGQHTLRLANRTLKIETH